MTRLVVRADGNAQIGFGHVMRCLAIVNGSSFSDILWFSSDQLNETIQRESKSFIQFQLISNEPEFQTLLKDSDVVLLDGYQFSQTDQHKIRATGAKLVLIDDLANQPVSGDVVINPTPGFNSEKYISDRPALFLMGLNYAMLRAPFLSLAKEAEIEKEVGSVLICMGGSDPMNFTERILEVTITEPFQSIHVVVGSGYQFHSSLDRFIYPRIVMHRSLDAQEMAELMTRCEWGIYPSSGILLEALAAKQRIISGVTADNQHFVHEAHLKLNTLIDAQDFSSAALKTAFKKMDLFPQSQQVIDGLSIERINTVINRLVQTEELHMRRATARDTEQTYKWANDPVVRKYSFEQHEISLDEHTRWFNRKVNDSMCFYYLLEDGNRLIGSIRFDIKEGDALISYLLDPSEHGKGIGLFLLKMGMEHLLMENQDTFYQFIGEVMPENKGSVRIFEQLGFNVNKTEKSLRFSKKYSKYVYH